MRYVVARYTKIERETAYRIYVTDMLYYQGQNKSLNMRYIDLIEPKKQDTRSGDEIAEDVISRLGLSFED